MTFVEIGVTVVGVAMLYSVIRWWRRRVSLGGSGRPMIEDQGFAQHLDRIRRAGL